MSILLADFDNASHDSVGESYGIHSVTLSHIQTIRVVNFQCKCRVTFRCKSTRCEPGVDQFATQAFVAVIPIGVRRLAAQHLDHLLAGIRWAGRHKLSGTSRPI